MVPAEAAAALDRWLGVGNWTAVAIAGDASTRSHFRVSSGGGATRILTFYPPDVRDGLVRSLRAFDALRGIVPVPQVLEHDDAVVLQQDVGDESLTRLLDRDRDAAVDRYRDAVSVLGAFARVESAGRELNPEFDQAKFLEELDMTGRFYVEAMGKVDASPLRGLFALLAARLTKHPYILCHRDYHGHNIHLFNNQLYIIDYQDMKMGPDTYDLASLLRDRGVWQALGSDGEDGFIADFARSRNVSLQTLRIRYMETLLQRSIKALGTFARLVVVYGRRQYLAYIDPTLETVRACARELDEWRDLEALFPFEYEPPEAGV